MTGFRIARPQTGEHVPYYGKYVSLVPGEDAWPALERQLDETIRMLAPLDDARALHRYAPGKWSVKETVGHIVDVERVFAHRALRFGRGDATALPGFDENSYVPAGRFDGRALPDLLEDLRLTRAASRALFGAFEPDALTRMGTANDSPVSVRALAWIICGHELHHRALLRERYGIAG
jgi:hypothetical protein